MKNSDIEEINRFEKFIDINYGNFIKSAANWCINEFKKDTGAIFEDDGKLRVWLMKNFGFSYSFDKEEIGIKDEELRELFCRRALDDFPWGFIPNIDDIEDVSERYRMYFRFFVLKYFTFCLEHDGKNLKNGLSKNVIDKLEYIVDTARNNRKCIINYIYSNKNGYCHLVFKN